MRTRPLLAALFAAVAAASCAGPSALRPAKSGDIAALRSALDSDIRAGRLSRQDVADIAQELASHEVEAAQGPAAIQRMQQVQMCARQLEAALEDRAKGSDPAAPDAAMDLLMAKRADPDTWRTRASDVDPGWRAVGVRSLITKVDGNGRRAAMLDPDERVRLAAVRASEDGVDPADLPVLLDTARRDPNSLVRVTAVRAAAALGNADTVLRLKDMWVAADEPLREAIVAAWAWPGMLEAGGQRELIEAAESGKGTPTVIAGGILMRLGPETRGVGISTLLKNIQSGVARDRAFAIAMAPLDDPAVKEAIRKASTEKEPEVQVSALTRLASNPADRQAALQALGPIAASSWSAAARAKASMARLGDRRVTQLLIKDGQSKDPSTRVEAARLLLALDDVPRAVMFLADPDAGVRTRVACEILVASERR